MIPMPPYRRYQTLRTMTVALCAFVVVSLVLESGGLLQWAQRLEVGPERTVALPACQALHRALAPLGIEAQRRRILIKLAKLGWSDDAALLASVKPKPAQPTPASSPAQPQPTSASATSPSSSPAVPTSPRPAPTPWTGSLAEPPLIASFPQTPEAAPAAHTTVALTGDSMMAVGLSASILRDAPRFHNLSFLNLFKSGTGLARPEVFNWQLEYPAMLHEREPDFVIVAIGANDAQGFQVGRTVYPFASAAWDRLYAERVAAFLRMLTAHGATVLWVGLPPMKDSGFSARIDLINRIQYSVVSTSPHAIWFSSTAVIGDAQGKFRDFGNVRGRPARLRAGDGIHMSNDGAELLAAKLLPWLAAQPAKSDAPAKPFGDAGAGPTSTEQ